MWDWISLLLDFGALAGCVYLAYATFLVGRSFRRGHVRAAQEPSVSILKPLHGAEPLLVENLETFCRQDYGGNIQIILGVDSLEDTALPQARRLAAEARDVGVEVVVAPRGPGANPKVANLVNMVGQATNEVIVLADSDIRVGPDYLRRLMSTLGDKGVGAVTCLYDGLGVTGLWSRMSAAAIETHFLPSVVFGMAIGLAEPCFGSTIALKRSLLEEIGGLSRFADCLADDYAIGAAVRATGRRVAVAPMTVTHVCSETTLAAMLRHELRWARTVRSIDPVGFAGSALTHPFALALLALAAGGGRMSAAIAVVALMCRCALWVRLDMVLERRPSGYWMIPLRSLLSFAVYVAAFFGRRVDWQGDRFEVDADGTLIPARRWTP
jgi:ceramide glucosyltransferase